MTVISTRPHKLDICTVNAFFTAYNHADYLQSITAHKMCPLHTMYQYHTVQCTKYILTYSEQISCYTVHKMSCTCNVQISCYTMHKICPVHVMYKLPYNAVYKICSVTYNVQISCCTAHKICSVHTMYWYHAIQEHIIWYLLIHNTMPSILHRLYAQYTQTADMCTHDDQYLILTTIY